MRRSNPRLRISIGLAGLVTSIALLGSTLGVFPNERKTIVQTRQALCESLGVTFSTLANHVDKHQMEMGFQEILNRSPEVQSIGIRLASGELLIDVGNHVDYWNRGMASDDSQLTVPIDGSEGPFGKVEMRFQSPVAFGLASTLLPPEIRFAVYLGVASCLAFYLYLRYVLTQLNPSRAIPPRVREALDTLAEGLLILDPEQRVVLANAALQKVIGRPDAELIGLPAHALPLRTRSPSHGAAASGPWQEAIVQGTEVRGHLMEFHAGGEGSRTFSVSCSPIVDDRGNRRGAIASLEDVTELESQKLELQGMVHRLHESSAEIKRQNEALEILATRDPLTGCMNRRSFFEAFDQHWEDAQTRQTSLATIMVDVDHFKSINDNYGHAVGDEVLQLVGSTLRNAAREHDLVCRYGGEEFTILMPQTTMTQAAQLAEIIREQLQQVQHPMLSITASLGVSANSEGVASAKALLEQADQCLYLAKKNGRNQVVSMTRVHADFDTSDLLHTPTEEMLQTVHDVLHLCDVREE